MGSGSVSRRTRALLAGAGLLAGLLLVLPAAAQGSCSRAQLQAAVDDYITAQGRGDASAMNLAASARYVQNMQRTTRAQSILGTPMKIDFHRSLLDTTSCETFTEVIVTDPSHAYVLGVRQRVVLGTVSEFDALVTDRDDWLFNADTYLKYSAAEDWGEIPAAARDTRETLIAAAHAYEDRFLDEAVVIPWGTPCNRLEGGIRSGKDAPDDSCAGGFPTGMNFADRRVIVDPHIGAVVLLAKFTDNDLPDSHLFRLRDGRIRYVHTLTVCTVANCGFPSLPAPSPAPAARP